MAADDAPPSEADADGESTTTDPREPTPSADASEPSGRWSDRLDAPDGIVLYALGTYAIVVLFGLALVDVSTRPAAGGWVVAAVVAALVVAWGVALVGLVTLRTWGWVASLGFHGLAFLLSLLTGNLLFVLVLLLSGFYVLSQGSLYLEGGEAAEGSN